MNDIDIIKFQEEVTSFVHTITHSRRDAESSDSVEDPDLEKRIIAYRLLKEEELKTSLSKLGIEEYDKKKLAQIIDYLQRKNISIEIVVEVIRNDKIKRFICPLFKCFTGDVMAMALVVTPILLSLSLSGVNKIPTTPLFFAGFITVITRMGVAGYCGEEMDKKRLKVLLT